MAHVVLRMDAEIVYDDEAVQGFHAIETVRSFPDGPHDFLLTLSRDPNTATCNGNVSLVGAQFQGFVWSESVACRRARSGAGSDER